jgi:hypothetical protein
MSPLKRLAHAVVCSSCATANITAPPPTYLMLRALVNTSQPKRRLGTK